MKIMMMNMKKKVRKQQMVRRVLKNRAVVRMMKV